VAHATHFQAVALCAEVDVFMVHKKPDRNCTGFAAGTIGGEVEDMSGAQSALHRTRYHHARICKRGAAAWAR